MHFASYGHKLTTLPHFALIHHKQTYTHYWLLNSSGSLGAVSTHFYSQAGPSTLYSACIQLLCVDAARHIVAVYVNDILRLIIFQDNCNLSHEFLVNLDD